MKFTVAPELRAQRERIAAAKRVKVDRLPEFFEVLERTLQALRDQPFAVQVACGLDALEAELLILKDEG